MVTEILVPYDGSDCAARGVEHALDAFPDAELTVLRVVDPLDAVGVDRSEAPLEVEREGGSPAGTVPDVVPDVRVSDVEIVVEPGVPAATIVEYASAHDPDAIVMGSHDRSPIERVLFGTVSGTVADHAPVPVTQVPA